MNEHHYQRIDKGVERKAPQDAAGKPRNPDGTFPSTHTHEARLSAIADALEALERGETTDEIAARHKINGRTLRSWLIAYPQADQARAVMVASELSRTLEELKTADSPLPLARAREEFRGWAWIGERRLPQYFGQKQEVTHTIKPEFNVILKQVDSSVIDGESTPVLPDLSEPSDHP